MTSAPATIAAPTKVGYDPAMTRSAWRWIYAFAVIFLAGPLCCWLVGAVDAVDGSAAAGATLSARPAIALLALLGAGAVAAIAGLIGARFFSERTGLVGAGLALSWTPWAVGRLDDFAHQPFERAIFPSLAIEGAIIGALAVALAITICRQARRSGHGGDPANSGLLEGGMLGPIIALVVGGIAAWVVARSYDPGQGFGAAFCAGLFGSLVGRVVDNRSPDRAYFAIVPALAVAAPLIAAFASGAQAVAHIYAGEVFPPGMVMPMDWLAGSLVGIPMGTAWAGSIIEKKLAETARS